MATHVRTQAVVLDPTSGAGGFSVNDCLPVYNRCCKARLIRPVSRITPTPYRCLCKARARCRGRDSNSRAVATPRACGLKVRRSTPCGAVFGRLTSLSSRIEGSNPSLRPCKARVGARRSRTSCNAFVGRVHQNFRVGTCGLTVRRSNPLLPIFCNTVRLGLRE